MPAMCLQLCSVTSTTELGVYCPTHHLPFPGYLLALTYCLEHCKIASVCRVISLPRIAFHIQEDLRSQPLDYLGFVPACCKATTELIPWEPVKAPHHWCSPGTEQLLILQCRVVPEPGACSYSKESWHLGCPQRPRRCWEKEFVRESTGGSISSRVLFRAEQTQLSPDITETAQNSWDAHDWKQGVFPRDLLGQIQLCLPWSHQTANSSIGFSLVLFWGLNEPELPWDEMISPRGLIYAVGYKSCHQKCGGVAVVRLACTCVCSCAYTCLHLCLLGKQEWNQVLWAWNIILRALLKRKEHYITNSKLGTKIQICI